MHLFVDNLTNVDFSYLDATRGLVGETWLASITLECALDEQGMVCDFGVVKKTVRNWLDNTIDHCLVIPSESEALLEFTLGSGKTQLEWQYQQRTLTCLSPEQAITPIKTTSITAESVAEWCIAQLREQLPDTIDKISLTFTPENIDHHFYHYSHGLKKHQGNCQRIAHGHRSTIAIFRDDKRDHALEAEWSEQWRDIYIGTRSDLIDTIDIDGTSCYHFAYTAEQGEFELHIPTKDCYLIDTDSTVEFIAKHIADTIKQQYPTNDFTVRAYEGAGKGAVAFA